MVAEYLILGSLGLISGVLAGFFGIGGGTLIVPAMILLGHDIKTAIGISVMQMAFSSLFGSYLNFKKSNLDLNDGLYVGIGGFMGALLSGVILENFPTKVLEILFFCLVLFSIYRFGRNPSNSPRSHTSSSPLPNTWLLIGIGFCVGLFAISLGIGGGLLLAPLLGYYLGYDSKRVVPIALFFVIFSSLAGFLSLAYHGLVDYQSGLIIGVASLMGVQLGISLLQRLDAKRHKKALLVMYLLVLGVIGKKILGL